MNQEVVAEGVFVGFSFNDVYNTNIITSISAINFFAVEVLLNLTCLGASITINKVPIITLIDAEIFTVSTDFNAAFLLFDVNKTVIA